MNRYIKFLPILLILLGCNSNTEKKTETVQNKTNSEAVAMDASKNNDSENDVNTNETILPQNLKEESIKRGKLVYDDMCITCHMPNGKGVTNAFPPVANSDYLRKYQDKSIIGIKKGMSGKMVVNGVTYNSVMSPLGLSDKEVADVMNYINNSWGNDIDNFVTPEKVSKVLP